MFCSKGTKPKEMSNANKNLKFKKILRFGMFENKQNKLLECSSALAYPFLHFDSKVLIHTMLAVNMVI